VICASHLRAPQQNVNMLESSGPDRHPIQRSDLTTVPTGYKSAPADTLMTSRHQTVTGEKPTWRSYVYANESPVSAGISPPRMDIQLVAKSF
jgi:hypothetical protein